MNTVVTTPSNPAKAVRTKKSIDLGQYVKLRSQGVTLANCAKCMGVSVNTLKKITSNLRELDVWLSDPQRVAVFKDNEASVLDGMRASIMNIISSIINNKKLADKATFSNLPSLNILYGTLFDKQRLLRDQSTSNIAQLSRIIKEAHSEARNVAESQ